MLSDQRRTPILRVLVGSRAHNLHEEDSDFDYRGVFVIPTVDLLALGKNVKNTNWVEGKIDDTSWEVGHFLFMATKCNPNILDVFRVKSLHELPMEDALFGSSLQKLWPHILSRRAVRDAFLGYSHNQFKKMMDQEAVDTPRVWKFGVTYLRALAGGIELLQTGGYTLYTYGPWRDFLKHVRAGEVSRGVIIDKAVELQADIHRAYSETVLPEAPNLEAVNEYLLDVRQFYWNW
jgi:hypothetical protein